MKNNVFDWYLELRNTSSVEAMSVIQSDPFAEECKNVPCSDGRQRDLWKVELRVIEKAVGDLKLHLFNVLTSEEGSEPKLVTLEKVPKASEIHIKQRGVNIF